jgi:hypothetical protein
MKLRWSLAAMGTSMALGLGAAQAAENLAPVVRVDGNGNAAVAAAPTVAMPAGDNCGSSCGDSCANTCGGCCEIFFPQMIGNDLPTNVYAGTFIQDPNGGIGYGLLPQVQRGSFKISDNESPMPTDRAFVTYSYFNRVNAPALFLTPVAGAGLVAVNRNVTTDVHRTTWGMEKTFLNGDASLGFRMNVIQQDGEIQDDDFGDTTVIAKYALVNRTDMVLSGGLAVTAPTGTANAGAFGPSYRSVLFQPYSAFIWNRERLFIHGFNAIIFSTDDNDPIIATYDFGAGYRVFQTDDCKNSWLNYVIPTAEVHANLPLSKEGFANRIEFAQPDSLIATLGLHVGIGCRTNLTIGAGVPLSGPQLYDIGAMAQLNWRF